MLDTFTHCILPQADNERLVAMLAETKEWRGMAREMADGCGLHYIPVEEALVQKVRTSSHTLLCTAR